jgi:hypothetical protein
MFKMGSNDPFGYLKHKLWTKKGSKIKLAIWLATIKVQNRLDFLMCRWCATYRWKAFDEGYNFALNFTSIEGLHTKLWASKVMGVLILGISGLSFGSLGTKLHLGVGPVARHMEYYMGDGGGFTHVQVVVSLVSPCLLVAHSCTKVF